jgi:hypothetical protein
MPIIIDPADAPHDTITNCDECHNGVIDRVPGATLDNAKCLVCHGPAGGATLVEEHHGDTRFPALTTNCTDCHNVMRPMANASHVKPVVNGATVSFSGTDYVHGAPNYDGICETCHTLTNQYRNDPSSPVTDHNVGSVCTSCHTHDTGFTPSGGEADAPHNPTATPGFPTDCQVCHDGATSNPIPNTKCLGCHDVGAPGSTPTTLADWSACRTESGTTNIPDGNASVNVTLATPITSVFQAFMLMDSAGPAAVQNGADHMVAGDILDNNTLTFDREGTTGQVDISYAVVECFNNEFSVASGEITIASGNTSNTAAISTVDTARSLVIVNSRTDAASTTQSDAHVTGELLDATTVQVARSAAANGANTFVTYQVVEFSVGSAVSVQTGEVTLGSGTSITDTLAAVDLSSSWLYFSYDATDDGPQQTAINGQITAPSVVTFARHASNAYTNRIRYYVVEFPSGEVTVQTGSSNFNGSATTHNIGFGGVAAINKAFTFVSNTTLDAGGGGGGAPLNQTDDFNGLSDGTRPNFGNWTGVNGSDGTLGWVVLTGSTGSGTTGPSSGTYVYLESSASGQTYGVDVTAGSSQYIESNVIDAGAYTTMSFTFDWNMNVNDNTDASLHLDAWNGSSWDLDVNGGAVNTGNNGDTWVTTGPVDVSSYSNADFQLRIRYIVGSGTIYQNDVAVDNLVIDGTGGTPTAYPINRWTEVLSSTSNIRLSNGRGAEADSNADMQWQVVEFTGSGPIISGIGSDLKVDTHHSPIYGGTQDCVTCHNPMYPQSNYRHIRSTINGATVVFTAATEPDSARFVTRRTAIT